jgi:non-ribosomal peptide synthase protein (TIGR01720 family)
VRGFDIISAIRRTVLERHGVQAHRVVLVAPGEIPRVGHGKIGRGECRARLLAGTLQVLEDDVLDPAAGVSRAGVGSPTYQPPRSEIERTLAGIWQQVLGLPRVGIHDAFADLGGDSLLSMQVLLAAESAGLSITAEDVQVHGTIATLAEAIEGREEKAAGRVEPHVGEALLLPRQRFLLRQEAAAGSKPVLSIVLEAREPLDEGLLERSIQHLLFQHDALRLRCTRTEHGWVAEYAGHTTPGLAVAIDLPESSQRDQVNAEIARLRESLDVERGPMIRVGLIRRPHAPDLVPLVVHHVVSDAYSLAILARDLDTVYGQLAAGEPPQLPAPTTTVQEWRDRADTFARSRQAIAESAYWGTIASSPPTTLPADFAAEEHPDGGVQIVQSRFGPEATGRLRQLQREGLSLPDLLHHALARALAQDGTDATAQFWTVSHGRASVLPGVDLSHTVGFLVRGYPVRITLPAAGDELEASREVRDQLRRIPNQGMGFEILANFSPRRPIRHMLTRVAPPVRLNYVGDLDLMYAGLRALRKPTGWETDLAEARSRGKQAPRHVLLAVDAVIEDGNLRIDMTYDSRVYRPATVEHLAERMVETLSRLASSTV